MSHPLQLALQLLSWLLALAWLNKFFDTARGLPKIPNLALAKYDQSPAGGPSLTVIVPARNEAAHIAACLQSLSAQDYGNLSILAVDDRSIDDTGSILVDFAAGHRARLTTLHIRELPANWLGKTHAMAIAARQAIADHNPEYLLFTDADILFHPEILRRALAESVASQADHFVILPTALFKTRGEAMILSFLQVIGLWAVRPWRIADAHARDAVGVGAFNLIRTSAYLSLGGFEALRMEIVEDLALGRRVKQAGLRQRIAYAPGMVNVHWAAGLFGIVNNMTKNLFAIFRFQPAFLLLAAVSLGIFCVAPMALLAGSNLRLPAILTFAAIAGIYQRSGRLSRISAWYAVLFPVSGVLVVYSMLRSMIITLAHGGVSWRGTFYTLESLREKKDSSADQDSSL